MCLVSIIVYSKVTHSISTKALTYTFTISMLAYIVFSRTGHALKTYAFAALKIPFIINKHYLMPLVLKNIMSNLNELLPEKNIA